MTHYFIKQSPEGTIINVVSSAGGMTVPAISAYSIAKLAQIKFGEYVELGQSLFVLCNFFMSYHSRESPRPPTCHDFH